MARADELGDPRDFFKGSLSHGSADWEAAALRWAPASLNPFAQKRPRRLLGCIRLSLSGAMFEVGRAELEQLSCLMPESVGRARKACWEGDI